MLKTKLIQLLNILLRKNKKKSKQKTYHYIKPTTLGIWNHFRVLLIFSILSFSSLQASTINWEVSNIQNPNNRAIYGLVGDTAFQQQVIDSLKNNTFSPLMASNPQTLPGGVSYSANSLGYVKSIDFNISPSIKDISMFIIILNNSNPNSYSYANISDVNTKIKLDQKVTNTFSFDMAQAGFTEINNNNVPEPTISLLLVIGSSILLLYTRNKPVMGSF